MFLVVANILTVEAQVPKVREVFMEAPAEVLPSLGDVERANILSEYDAVVVKGTTPASPSRNILGGEVKVLNLSDSYIQMSLDPTTELQIKLLPCQDIDEGRFVIMLVVTSMTVPEQSVIALYNHEWLRLDTEKYWILPNAEDYFLDPKDIQLVDVKNALVERGRLSYKVVIDVDNPEFLVKVTTFGEELAKMLHPEVLPLLKKDGITYKWSVKGHFNKM